MARRALHPAVTIGLCILLLLSARQTLALPLIFILGLQFALFLSHKLTDDRIVFWVTGFSYFVRATLAALLYYASDLRWPVFPSLQLGDGFWTFSIDSLSYHRSALQLVEAWQRDVKFPFSGVEPIYTLIVARIYALLGPHPLFPIAVNVAVGSLTGLLAYEITRRLSQGGRGEWISAALVSFWPSSILWSTQLLKDSISVALTLLLILIILFLWKSPASAEMSNQIKRFFLWILLFVTTFSVSYVRWPLVYILTGVLFLIWVSEMWKCVLRQRLQKLRVSAITTVIVASFISAMVLETYTIFLSSVASDRGVESAQVNSTSAQSLGDALRSTMKNLLPWSLIKAAWKQRKRHLQIDVVDVEFGHALPRDPSVLSVVGGMFAALLGPYPWDWLEQGKSTGIFKVFSSFEALLMYILVPFALWAAWRLVRFQGAIGVFVVGYAFLGVLSLGYVYTNMGTVFRLRLLFLLIVAVLASEQLSKLLLPGGNTATGESTHSERLAS